MKRMVASLGAFMLMLGMAPTLAAPQDQQPVVAKTNLKVGDMAPDFTLLSDKWEPVKLSDYRGKKTVILAFYVLAFTSG